MTVLQFVGAWAHYVLPWLIALLGLMVALAECLVVSVVLIRGLPMTIPEVRCVEDRDDEARHLGRIGLWVSNEFSPDTSVSLAELLDLRAAIDRFLFTSLHDGAHR